MSLTRFFESQSFTPEDAACLASIFKIEQVFKGQKILELDNHGKKVYYVEKGLLRTYYLKDGKDITHYFFEENTFTLPLESIFYNRPSPYGLEALEPGTVLSVSYHEIEKMAETYPALQKVISFLLIDVLRSFSDRLHSIQFQSAQERYKTIEVHQPGLLLRANLGHIASYIGITQQTLSVLRAQR
ncbi:cAMP-binding domain of CRP or a regulatory subunit of cAMP-dependent protein kinases [Dyadobacter koreensis]|uniref:cAMP-binding domain of CRP or a regulatory subunit of cAMP-dependent protein kinases n=1 Tax=Dyadobacter koreensis TaxID=408657 RepID=A0A1H7AZL0_9BACT|nr:Crp/Fnr family transcriptional regulator [Dyadobacter koreensis]SEJ69357.1 cAMP-binding domain of CRP or a regulatory subunit of cAMP-dependent protein kinases [Dyadobacter koreensis]